MNTKLSVNKKIGSKPISRLSLSLIGAMSLATLSSQAAFADESPMKFYGILDTGVEHITNIGADGDSLTRVPAITGTMASRFGVSVEKPFGEKYKGIAKLEMGYNADDGTQGQAGRLFGRQVYFGAQTPYGRFTIGRQYSVFLFAAGTADLMGPNIYALGSLDAYLPNARYDNSLSWINRFGKNITAGITYSFGRDTSGGVPASGTCKGEETQVGDSSACRAWSGMLKYTGSNFGVAAGIDTLNGGSGARAFFFNGNAPIDMSDSGDTDRRITLGGYYTLGAGKIGVGMLSRKLDSVAADVESKAVYVTGSYKVNPKVTLDGGIYKMTNDDQDADATLAVIRGMYNLDKGLDVYAQIGTISNSDNASYALSGAGGGTAPAAGEGQVGTMVGMRFKF